MKFSPKNKVRWLFILVLSPALAVGQAKLSNNKDALAAYTRAGNALSSNLYGPALQELKNAIRIDPDFAAAYQRSGDIYRLQRSWTEARDSYRHVLAIDTGFYRGTWFGLGESELNLGEYEAALGHLQRYAGYGGVSPDTKKKIDNYLADCVFSIEAVKHPVAFSPVNLGPSVNTADWEYLPALTADEETLLFTRQAGGKEDFFYSRKVNGKWQPSQYLQGEVNTPQWNEGAQCLSPDGRYIFFTRCNNPDGAGSCDIYLAGKENGKWTAGIHLGAGVNTRFWESQPSVSADGNTLYFVSNRPGGIGGYDIYRSHLLPGGEWSAPENLGPTINTPYDEQSPFIHPDDQTLYFSSNGWPGLGNKDVFVSRKDAQGNWQRPENLGYPINTFADEAGVVISATGRNAYFNAARDGGFGKEDIYTFELPDKLRPLPVTYVKGTVFDKTDKSPLSGTIVIADLATRDTVYNDLSDAERGEFQVTLRAGRSYSLHILAEGYLFYSQNIDIPNGASPKPYLLDAPMQPIVVGSTAALRNVFFETGKFDLLPQSKQEIALLAAFLRAQPKVVIEISGHTDNVGDDHSNQELSEKRAKAVYDALLNENKIAAARLIFRGYGETQPVADNATEEGRRLNRRTEFRILKL